MLVCANLVGIYFRFLTEASHKQTFQDTRNCIESRVKLEHERQQQVVCQVVDLFQTAIRCTDITYSVLQLR